MAEWINGYTPNKPDGYTPNKPNGAFPVHINEDEAFPVHINEDEVAVYAPNDTETTMLVNGNPRDRVVLYDFTLRTGKVIKAFVSESQLPHKIAEHRWSPGRQAYNHRLKQESEKQEPQDTPALPPVIEDGVEIYQGVCGNCGRNYTCAACRHWADHASPHDSWCLDCWEGPDEEHFPTPPGE